MGKISVDNIFQVLLCVLVSLLILFPSQFFFVKLLLCLSVGLIALSRSITSSRFLFNWFFLYVCASVFAIVVGLCYQIPKPFTNVYINVFEPIFFFVVFSQLEFVGYEKLKATVLISTLIVELACIAAFLALNFNTFSFFSPICDVFVIRPNLGGYNFGFVKISSQCFLWLFFVVALSFTELVTVNKCGGLQRIKILYGVVGLGIICSLLFLLTAFILTLIILPVIVWLGRKITGMCYRENFICKGIILVSIVLSVFMNGFIFKAIDGAKEKVIISFSSETYVNDNGNVDDGGYIRKEQIVDLLDTWSEEPIFGRGDSANANNVIRSETTNGAYEMTFFAMLMQRGIIGTLVWLGLVFSIYSKGIELIKQGSGYSVDIFSSLVGFTTMNMVNFTNPTYGGFDYILMFFFPLLVIEIALKESKCFRLHKIEIGVT